MAKRFTKGTIVMLNSGGPHMTVSSYVFGEDDICWCSWWDGSDYQNAKFNEACLTKIEPKGAKR
ncbi:hypothetical protein CHUUTOTORO_02430 [Serratia phage vB_SmaM-ChuuTotoro]|nr:hypothetical protein CHUUTOTORO_02430 [Serratia phage vB_SmaM-ChuuTotoro]